MRGLLALPLLLLLTACIRPSGRRDTAPEEAGPAPGEAAALPEGFEVRGEPEVVLPWLDARRAWRDMVSRLTTLRADAVARSEDILVTFEEGAVHATARSGRRRTWRLPEELRLEGGVPRHLLLGADLTTRAFGADGAQLPMADGLTIVVGRVSGAGGGVEEFGLAVKEDGTFRSISTAG